jgi:hypothetical protein
VAYPKESKETSRSGSTTDAAARSTTSAESKQLAS